MTPSEAVKGITVDLFSFPEGAETETIVFGEAAREQRHASLGHKSDVTCQRCESDLIHAVSSRPISEETWEVEVRCPECEWHVAIVVGRYVMERFIAQLHRQKRALACDLEHLDSARFREDVERDLALIREDILLPADF